MTFDDTLLGAMRHVGDPSADRVVNQLADGEGISSLNSSLRDLVTNEGPIPNDVPDPVSAWLRETRALPDGTDLDRVDRGCELVVRHAPQVALVLSTVSLVSCYAAYPGVRVLTFSQRLGHDPHRRLGETAQFVLSVTTPGALRAQGQGVPKIQKVRLLHAAIRDLVGRSPQWSQAEFGIPVCQEDLAGTLISFSSLVIDSLRGLGIPVREEEAEDYLYLWRVVGEMLGIDPALIPAGLAEAQRLAAAIARRNHRPSDEGVLLTRALLDAHNRQLPSRLHGLIPALVRAHVGEQVADWMQVPTSRWDKAMRLNRGAGRLVYAAQSLPGPVGGLLSQIGSELIEERAVEMAGRRDASFSIPAPADDLCRWSPSGVFPTATEKPREID